MPALDGPESVSALPALLWSARFPAAFQTPGPHTAVGLFALHLVHYFVLNAALVASGHARDVRVGERGNPPGQAPHAGSFAPTHNLERLRGRAGMQCCCMQSVHALHALFESRK